MLLIAMTALGQASEGSSGCVHSAERGAVAAAAADGFNAAEARVFDIEAYDFGFRVTPPEFVVNLGDSVSLRVRQSGGFHGFALERYAQSSLGLSTEPKTIDFVADKAGVFTFGCTNYYCGGGHFAMFGSFEVLGPETKPLAVDAFQPEQGASSGGTVVTITGSGFTKESKAYFGPAAALTIYSNETTLIALAPPQPPGAVPVTVRQPSGRNATSTGLYVYVAESRRRRAVR